MKLYENDTGENSFRIQEFRPCTLPDVCKASDVTMRGITGLLVGIFDGV